MKKNMNTLRTVILMLCFVSLLLSSCSQTIKGPGLVELSESTNAPVASISQDNVQQDNTAITPNLTFVKVLAPIDDEGKVNISTVETYDAFESVSQPDVVYIECGTFGWGSWLDDAFPMVYATKIVPHEFLMEPIIKGAEEAFPGKTLKFHVIFDNKEVQSIIGGSINLNEGEREEVRDDALKKLYEALQIEVIYEETKSGKTRVKSPDLYVTKAELDEICNCGIGGLFYRCASPTLEHMEKYHKDYMETYRDYVKAYLD